jgi:acetyl esterase/lipase
VFTEPITPRLTRQPGRLGRPDYVPRTDPRCDPRLLAALVTHGLDALAPDPPVAADDVEQARLDVVAAAERWFGALFARLDADLPPVPGVVRTRQTVVGPSGHEIELSVHRPDAVSPTLRPGVLHLHGGGMTLPSARGPVVARWRDEAAATGMVVIGVDLGDPAGRRGPQRHLADLGDCAEALTWAHVRRSTLGLSHLVVAGQSAGANLALATTLAAKRTGRLGMIDGVYAIAPCISGAYGWSDAQKFAHLPSLLENDGYVVNTALCAVIASLDDPAVAHDHDPLRWPYWAAPDDLAGLPPHVICVNELDIFRDEGIAYYRSLGRAGVRATCRNNMGVCHGAELMFRTAMPDLYLSTVHEVHRFAAGL